MNVKYSMVALLILSSIMAGSLIGEASAQTSMDIDISHTVEATNKSITDTLSDTLTRGVNLLVDIILAPFNAIATVFENWGANLSGWAGPIIAVFVIIVILIMVRIFSEFDEILDLNS